MSKATDYSIIYPDEKCVVCSYIKDCALFQPYGGGVKASFICNECSPLCWKCDRNIEDWTECTCSKYNDTKYNDTKYNDTNTIISLYI